MSRVSDQAFLVHIVSLGQVGDFGSLKKSRTAKLQILVE